MKLATALLLVPLLLDASAAWRDARVAVQEPVPPVMAVAKQLVAKRYQGWTYGPKTAEKQVDCVQFIAAVIEEALQRTLAEKARTQLLIADLPQAEIAAAILADDPRIRGLHRALVDTLAVADSVALEKAQPGDLVQYWLRLKEGSWIGHAAIIEKVEIKDGRTLATLYGAHRSPPPKGTLGTSTGGPLELRKGDDRRIFIARIRAKELAGAGQPATGK